MRRNATTGEITYCPQDMLLFRESPFASWMERLTLENPQHGISPDTWYSAPARAAVSGDCSLGGADFRRAFPGDYGAKGMRWQEFIVAAGESADQQECPVQSGAGALQVPGDDVMTIAAHSSEKQRSAATWAALQQGAACITNAQLTVGQISAPVDLLMRVSGISDLGSYLYMPCDTQGHLRGQRVFHLACAADLLSSLQGVLPSQMLILRDGEPVETLRSQDHIILYREVRKRFMAAQLSFRKHSMPDPVESSHFGRWTRCAQDILKHRAAAAQGASCSAAVHTQDCTIGQAS